MHKGWSCSGEASCHRAQKSSPCASLPHLSLFLFGWNSANNNYPAHTELCKQCSRPAGLGVQFGVTESPSLAPWGAGLRSSRAADGASWLERRGSACGFNEKRGKSLSPLQRAEWPGSGRAAWSCSQCVRVPPRGSPVGDGLCRGEERPSLPRWLRLRFIFREIQALCSYFRSQHRPKRRKAATKSLTKNSTKL